MTKARVRYDRCKWPVVYALRHNVTNKLYVGATCDLGSRIYSHITALRRHNHPSKLLQHDYDIYGDDISYAILAECNTGDTYTLHRLEKLYMTILDTKNPDKGYNGKDNFRDDLLKDLVFHKIPESPTRKSLDPRVESVISDESDAPKSPFYYARKKAGVTGTELSKALGVSRSTVNNWDRGVTKPSGKKLVDAANYLSCSIDSLFIRKIE